MSVLKHVSAWAFGHLLQLCFTEQVNWGRAMALRAELAEDADLATQLYNSALDKFEAVLEEEPNMVTAKNRRVAP
jgi:hypothetical protein